MPTAPRAGGAPAAPPSPETDRPSAVLAPPPPSLGWLAEALTGAGLTVHETDGWRSRALPGDFAPVGVLLHHTGAVASPEAPAPSLATLRGEGPDAASPGPRCHVLVDRNAECWVVAAGRADHAGRARASGPVPEGDASALYVGLEIEYAATAADPTQYATSAQKSAAVLAAARIVGALGRDHTFVRAHKETSTTGRTDPFNWDMVSIRDSIRQTLERTGW